MIDDFDTRVANTSDAVMLLDNLLALISQNLIDSDISEILTACLRSLKDAIERGIV
jgi:uncharacterized protein YeeX (DUF496 family)